MTFQGQSIYPPNFDFSRPKKHKSLQWELSHEGFNRGKSKKLTHWSLLH